MKEIKRSLKIASDCGNHHLMTANDLYESLRNEIIFESVERGRDTIAVSKIIMKDFPFEPGFFF